MIRNVGVAVVLAAASLSAQTPAGQAKPPAAQAKPPAASAAQAKPPAASAAVPAALKPMQGTWVLTTADGQPLVGSPGTELEFAL